MIQAIVCLILAWVLVDDMRHFVVRNVWVVLLVASFALDCVFRDRITTLGYHALFGIIGLALMSGVFAFRMVGGGDAKLMSAALFWVGAEGLFIFAIALFCCTICYAVGAWLRFLPARMINGRTMIPFGPSIAAAWIVSLGLTGWL